MEQINTLRPGVFSQYRVTSMYRGTKSGQNAALLADFGMGQSFWLESYEDAVGALQPGAQDALLCLRILFESGVGRVFCCHLPSAATTQQLEDALEEAARQQVYVVVLEAVQEHMGVVKSSMERNSKNGRERIAICPGTDPELAMDTAKQLNSERVILTCPASLPKWADVGCKPKGIFTACALAGRLLGSGDGIFNSGIMDTLLVLKVSLTDLQVENLLAAGVTPFEMLGGNVECIRAVTTRTKTKGIADRSFAPVGTVMIIDDVMTSVRQLLKNEMGGLKNTPQDLSAIASQVTVLLSQKEQDGLLTAFELPKVYTLPDDPTVCIVDLAFNVAFAVNQIHIKAHIIV